MMPDQALGCLLIGLSLTPVVWSAVRVLSANRGLPGVFDEMPETPIGYREPLNYGVEATRQAFEGEGQVFGSEFNLSDLPLASHVYVIDVEDTSGRPLRIAVVDPFHREFIIDLRKELQRSGYSTDESTKLIVAACSKKHTLNDKMGETLPGGRASPRDESPPSGVHEVVLSEGGIVSGVGSSKEHLYLTRGAVVKWYSGDTVDFTPTQELEIDDAGVIGTIGPIENPSLLPGVHEVGLRKGGRVKTPGSSVDLSLPPVSVVKWHSEGKVDLSPRNTLDRDQADFRKRVSQAVINMQKAEEAARERAPKDAKSMLDYLDKPRAWQEELKRQHSAVE